MGTFGEEFINLQTSEDYAVANSSMTEARRTTLIRNAVDFLALLSRLPWSSRRGARRGGGCHSSLLTKPTLASTCSWTT